MIILKILLTIIRIPFTLWYILTGWFFLLIAIATYASTDTDSNLIIWFSSFFSFEFASLTKFYNIREANLDGAVKCILKIAFGAGFVAGAAYILKSLFLK